jgi:hypothetical protein
MNDSSSLLSNNNNVLKEHEVVNDYNNNTTNNSNNLVRSQKLLHKRPTSGQSSSTLRSRSRMSPVSNEGTFYFNAIL